ncbi:DUF1203 domain-containing protein [Pseudoxanthomonas sp.]|uniref:DUF1203 domain-containing protein n=1 Tax=Pseudoxanthomonas sp. TaxID=1871049 RepID=UPI002632779D|nr:DUF1203 domain-containing protein [Pseudoxanthomonas sp.]WDS35727.1 MAG: DUF1203 domain-containing protein [Pseudoxanthomonas sp.]
MASFILRALDAALFAGLFERDDATLGAQGIVRRIVASDHGTPCRVSLQDARRGEEVLLLPYVHHGVHSPYRASGPIFVRRGVATVSLAVDEVPAYVASRLISLRAYDAAGLMVMAEVCDGGDAGAWLCQAFEQREVAYVHLHNARQGCYACRAERAHP